MDVLEDFISLFFPRCCYGCSEPLVKGEELICTKCIHDLPRSDFHQHRENNLFRRLHGRIHVVHALAFLRFEKTTMVQHLLHALKYRQKPEIGSLLGQVYGEILVASGFRFDVIVPVPLHATKLRSRGYNQSAAFAHGLGESMQLACDEEALSRTRKTLTQTRKTRLRRWENVRDAFAVTCAGFFSGKHVLLVDDVVTTGATLEACGQAIIQDGCDTLSVACIAVA